MKPNIQPSSYKKEFFILITALIAGIISFYITKSWITSLTSLGIIIVLLGLYFIIRANLKKSAKIKKMEDAFPDFLQLVSSNLRAGMTIDRALLLSSREEFAPLDKEIFQLGKDILTGKEIEKSLIAMSQRINSEKIQKTISLLTSSIKTGGNLAVLLEEISVNVRERAFIEKRAASSVLMYTIFIFFAIAAGAPVLFGLSSALVQILSNLFVDLPSIETTANLPFSISKINISPIFVMYFSMAFLVVTDILGSLVLGLIGKGNERAGTKYIVPLIAFSISIFLAIRIVFINFFAGFIS